MAARKSEEQKKIPALEWIAAFLGLAVVATMGVFLVLEALSSGARLPPVMHVEPVGLTRGGSIYVLELKVFNSTGQTGAAVNLEGTLTQGGREVETSNATISYRPGKSSRRAGLVFTRDPRSYDVELRVTGYEQP